MALSHVCAAPEMKMLISFQITEKPDISLLLLPYRDEMVADIQSGGDTEPETFRGETRSLGQELGRRKKTGKKRTPWIYPIFQTMPFVRALLSGVKPRFLLTCSFSRFG